MQAGFGFKFVRFYRSGSDHDGALGFGWSHSYEQTLTPAGANGADFDRFDGATGRTDRYFWDAAANNNAGAFVSPPGFYDRLQAQPDGTRTITYRGGQVPEEIQSAPCDLRQGVPAAGAV